MLRSLAVFTLAMGLMACGGGADVGAEGFSDISSGAGGAGGGEMGVGGAISSSTTAASSVSTSAGGGAPALKGPPYPIVLAHGFFGFNDFAGAGFLTYFYGVKDDLTARGEIVYTPSVDPFNDSTYRGAQLAEAVVRILEETGYEKVNLIGHSQGGLDARVVAHDHPELVASVTTISAPHQGTPVADVAMKLVGNPFLSDVLDWIVNVIGGPLYDQVGDETAISKPLGLFSKPGIAAFNAAYPDAAGVRYWSIGGRSNGSKGGAECVPDVPVSFINIWGSTTDPLDPSFALIQPILNKTVNDGMVPAEASRWGTFLGCIPADHMDQVGQLFGDGPGGNNGWSYLRFYEDLAEWIHAQGV